MAYFFFKKKATCVFPVSKIKSQINTNPHGFPNSSLLSYCTQFIFVLFVQVALYVLKPRRHSQNVIMY